MAIKIDVRSEDDWIHDVLIIMECAFAQDADSVLWKIKYEIARHPEILMVILIIIDEHQPYCSPACNAASYGEPIVITNHTWCHLGSVQFHVRIWGDEPINVNIDNKLLAHGTLFQNQDMSAVNTMIKKGMVMITGQPEALDMSASVCEDLMRLGLGMRDEDEDFTLGQKTN
ncbi:hypothetical protein BDR04DRAFT_1119694 [Suillus decipiens]|nr:hypothetical protein BDR04DRAFT_1119694 [Suillus decipiens]